MQSLRGVGFSAHLVGQINGVLKRAHRYGCINLHFHEFMYRYCIICMLVTYQ